MKHLLKIGKHPGGKFPERIIDMDEIAFFDEDCIFLKNGVRLESDPHLYNCLKEIFVEKPVMDTHVVEVSCVVFEGYGIDNEYNNGIKKPWRKES